MLFWHNIIDKKTENELRENNCFPKELSIYLEPTRTPTPKCDELSEKIEKQFAEVNIYDLYRKCWHEPKTSLYSTNSDG